MPNIGKYSFTGAGGTVIVKKTGLGEVRFLKAVNGSGTNFTNDIQIGNNSAYINSSQIGLNRSANITLYGTPGTGMSIPVLKKDGAICSDCYNFTALSAATVIFNVSSAGNYTIGDRAVAIASLNSGWNLFSMTMNNSVNGTNITIPVSVGWNLIGYSSGNESLHSALKFVNVSGTEQTWNAAVVSNKVKNVWSYYDSSSGNKKFKFVPYDDSYLRTGKGYWVYANVSGNITLKGVGGPPVGTTYAWSALLFRNSSGSVLNVTDAFNGGWIGNLSGTAVEDTVQYWDTSIPNNYVFTSLLPSRNSLNSWEGYFIWSRQDNITLLRQD